VTYIKGGLEQLLKREGRGGQTDLAARRVVTKPYLISAKEFVPLKNKYLGNLAKNNFLPKKISA
jgi:hypothetical protein